jgi:hypothetical protein
LIACKIFAQELEAALPPGSDVEIIWLEAALHTDPVKLKDVLETAISEQSAQEADVRILFGNGCHPDICGQASRCGATLPAAKNCIEIFCEKADELQADHTMIMTPGWIRFWQSMMKSLGWDEVDIRTNLGRYDKILLLDPGLVNPGIDPLTEEEIFSFFELTQVPIDLQPLDLSHFKKVLAQILG